MLFCLNILDLLMGIRMKFWIKSKLCRHNYKVIGQAEPISLFGIELWSRWDVKCTLCGKKKFGVAIDKVKDWEGS